MQEISMICKVAVYPCYSGAPNGKMSAHLFSDNQAKPMRDLKTKLHSNILAGDNQNRFVSPCVLED